jgi:predicted SprT family Zn-dependent metalloprotease
MPTTKSQIKQYFKNAKKHFSQEKFPKLKFIHTSKKSRIAGVYIQCINKVCISENAMKNKELTKNFWKCVVIHELTHFHVKDRNFQECHNKVFAKKLLSIYKKILNKEEIAEVLRQEKWRRDKDGETTQAYSVCKEYKLI